VRQGYDLLLDRYFQEVPPASLAKAAYEAVVKQLTEAGVSVKAPPSADFGGTRDEVFSALSQRLDGLLRESPPPGGTNLSYVVLSAMAGSLDEGHTFFMNPDQFSKYLASITGRESFVGVGIRFLPSGLTIGDVLPGTPAEAAGLKAGDVIVKIDGSPADDLKPEEIVQRIRGPEGSVVILEVQRPSTGETLQFSIRRAQIRVQNIATRQIQDDIAYVHLMSFSDPSAIEQFESFLDRPETRASRGLVVDLRGNGGGRTDFGQRLLNRFSDSGPLFMQVDYRIGWRRVLNAAGPGWQLPIPIAVLIDENTASMGELFASAMQEHGTARLFGKRTAGVVAGGQPFSLSDGSGFQITVVDILSGNGAKLNRVGVNPDQQVETSPDDVRRGRDTPLEAAVLYLWDRSASVHPVAGG
jgi:carboxyl-terminal processing protease